MNIHSIDRIMAAIERAEKLGSVPKSKVDEAVAQAMGITVEMVQEARRIHAEEFA
jgi:hypothetical protein